MKYESKINVQKNYYRLNIPFIMQKLHDVGTEVKREGKQTFQYNKV